jgi:hypothetical protein
MLELQGHPFMLVPSTTPGHWHLYVDKAMTWDEYSELLEEMVDHRIVSADYYDASVVRRMTRLRKPGVRKD